MECFGTIIILSLRLLIIFSACAFWFYLTPYWSVHMHFLTCSHEYDNCLTQRLSPGLLYPCGNRSKYSPVGLFFWKVLKQMRFALSITQRSKNLVICRWERKVKRPVLTLSFSVPANSAAPQSSSGCTLLKIRAEFIPAYRSPARTRMAINIFSREITTEASAC